MPTAHLAIDLGSGSGRTMLGVLDGDPLALRLTETHRFEHQPLNTPAGPVWDFTTLWREVMVGLRSGAEMAKESGAKLVSIGADTWGVDWAIVEPGGELLGLPHTYRDPANLVARDRVFKRIPDGAEALYTRNGIQPQPFNTLFQLDARKQSSPSLFEVEGVSLLLLPDLLHFWLSGVRKVERTNASTTGMLSLAGQWDRELLTSLGLPNTPLGDLIDPGTVLGSVRSELAAKLGIDEGVKVVAPATHDTASAIAAIPAAGETKSDWAYLSSGTWSLLGVEIDQPCATPEAFAAGFTNELGVGGRFRFLRNIAGLWLVQELKRDLEKQGQSLSFAELAQLAAASEPLRTLVDPNADDLAQPGDSIAKLRAHATNTGQPLPETPGQLARCCLESLALCYAETIEQIEDITSRSISTLYVAGGGVKNQFLNQLTADATGRDLKLGPNEATAIGNVLVQAMGLGRISHLEELRAVVARSLPAESIIPSPAGDWGAARQQYNQITHNNV